MIKRNGIPLLLCLFSGVILSVALKYELHWDFINYHYFNGFAFAAGRLGYDIAPVSVNSYLNPLLDALTFWLVNALNDYPDLYYAVTGVPFGLLLFACFKVNTLFFKSRAAVCLSMILAATGFAAWFQIGTSTNEIPLALLAVTALYFLLQNKRLFWAGALLGAAAGFKSTAGVYCVSSGAAYILFHRREYKNIALFALAGLTGFLTVNGFWMYELHKMFQNPFFPFFNGIFKSPYFDEINFSYRQAFENRGFWQAVLLPFSFAAHFDKSYAANIRFSDPRWAIAFLLTLGYLPFVRKRPLDRQSAFLAVWMLASYAVWLVGFSVARYLVPVEMLLPVFFVKAAIALRPTKPDVIKESLIYSLYVVVFAACVMTPLSSQEWGNRRGYAKIFDMPVINLPENTLVLTRNAPNSAYLALLAQKKPLRIVNQTDAVSPALRHYDFVRNPLFSKQIKALTGDASLFKIIWYSYDLPRGQIDRLAPEGLKCLKWFSDAAAAQETETGHLICVPESSFAAVFKDWK